MAHIELQQGHIETALDTYRAAVDLSRRARHADGLVQSLRMLGNTLLGLARYAEALPCLPEAAQLFAQLEDRPRKPRCGPASPACSSARRPRRPPTRGTPSSRCSASGRIRRSELEAREGLARALRTTRPAEAIPAFEAALTLAATIGERGREASIRNVLGILEWERGSYADALAHYEAALALVRDRGSRADEAVILNSLGAALTKLGRGDEARTVLEESLALNRDIGERRLEAHALAGLGHVD